VVLLTTTCFIGFLKKKWNKLATGIGVGYAWRGEYDYSENVKNYDPGDIITTAAELKYDFASVWQAKLFGETHIFGKNTADGDEVSQDGNYHLLGTGLVHSQSSWNVSFMVQGIFRGKSKFKKGTSDLSTESRNSMGNEWLAQLSGNYLLDDENTFNSFIQALWVGENDYEKDSAYYIGKRDKYTLGFGYSRKFLPYLEGKLNLKAFTMTTEETQWSDEDQTYQGFSAGIFIITAF